MFYAISGNVSSNSIFFLYITSIVFFFFFFFNDTATTEIYTLSLHDALPILLTAAQRQFTTLSSDSPKNFLQAVRVADRKSTRLNSSHMSISYAVFCLKKKKQKTE